MGSIRIKGRPNFLRPLFIGILIVTFAACDGGSGGGGGNDAESTAIGKDGGTVENANGAKVEIPAGALSENQNISITSYLTNDELPQGCAPIISMCGAVSLEPSGLTFEKPVTVTVPVSDYMEPRTQFPILYWNSSKQIWEQTEFIATVADNGMSFSADVTHFSEFGGSSIEDLIYGGTIEQFKNDFTAWFKQEFMSSKNPVAKNNECYQICGAEFDLKYQINDEADGGYWLTGDTKASDYADEPLVMVDYKYDIVKHGLDGFVIITSTMHYKCAQPDFLLDADKAALSEGESTTVRAILACAGVSLTGKEITFAIKSGPGEITPGRNTTGGNGEATATFTAGESSAVVNAFYYSCEYSDGSIMERETPIAVAAGQYSLTISFSQTMQQDNFLDSFTYGGTIPIRVTSKDTVSAVANVEGTATFGVNGSGTVGDCTTITEGSVTFIFTGTLVTDDQGKQTLNLTQKPDFETIKTTYCPGQTPLTNDFLVGGESSEFSIPAKDGHSWDQTNTFPGGSSQIAYVLNVLN
jgi:hypothetical protein